MKIGILADIHEDIVNLKKGLQILQKENCDSMICLGDIIGYHLNFDFESERDAETCVQLIKQNCNIVIIGNHDMYAAKILPPEESGYHYPDNYYELGFLAKYQYTKGEVWLHEDELPCKLSADSLAYLKSCGFYEQVNWNNTNYWLTHASIPNLFGIRKYMITLRLEHKQHLDEMKKRNCQIGICGHTHPDGLIFGNYQKIEATEFGIRQLNPNQISFISVPAIVRSKRKSGVSVLDTEKFTIQTICISE